MIQTLQLLPTKAEIFDHWKDRFRDLGFFIDWGEPSCWACRFHWGAAYNIKRPDASWEEIFDCWNRVPLQRCHIISRSLGGSDEPENLFLMCRECHDLAPNTNIPDIFFRWVRSQSHGTREGAKMEDAFRAFGIEGDALKFQFCTLMGSDEFNRWIADKFSLHFPQSNYPSVVGRLTPSTLIGLAWQYWREHCDEA
jgi:hypothetical protein